MTVQGHRGALNKAGDPGQGVVVRSQLLKKDKYGQGATRPVKSLAAQPGDLRFTPGPTEMKERTDHHTAP